MRKKGLLVVFIMSAVLLNAQNPDSLSNVYANAADNLLLNQNKLVVGGYGEVHYNQPLDEDIRSNGKLDVHRMVMLFGYNFNEKTQFVTELEFEHVVELYVEQAFLQHKLNRYINFRGGLLLVPMGIINEYHEPNTFNGVERPTIDNKIAPTTWREIGFGISGNVLPTNLKYQAYLVNGFNSYSYNKDKERFEGKLNGSKGLRSGRQKGAESYISSPNFTFKAEYYGIRGLNIGLSGYFGNTQSEKYDGITKDSDTEKATADSSVVGVSMFGADARYSYSGIKLRGQIYFTSLSNTNQYNAFTADTDGNLNDLGSSMIGYYVEAAYNVLNSTKTELQLEPFFRYEFLNTHNTVENLISVNDSYAKSIITTGITLALTEGAVIKFDMQFEKNNASDDVKKTLNAGLGVMF